MIIALLGKVCNYRAVIRRDTMAWIYLLLASILEIGWAVGLK